MSQEFSRRLSNEAQRLGCSDVRIGHTRRHPCLRATCKGKAIRIVFAGTSGDQYFGLRKAIADLRRAVRSVGGELAEKKSKSSTSCKRRHVPRSGRALAARCGNTLRRPDPPTPTRLDRNPLEQLGQFRQQLIQQLLFPSATATPETENV